MRRRVLLLLPRFVDGDEGETNRDIFLSPFPSPTASGGGEGTARGVTVLSNEKSNDDDDCSGGGATECNI